MLLLVGWFLSRGIRFLNQEVHFRIRALNSIPCYVLASNMSVCLENVVESNIFELKISLLSLLLTCHFKLFSQCECQFSVIYSWLRI